MSITFKKININSLLFKDFLDMLHDTYFEEHMRQDKSWEDFSFNKKQVTENLSKANPKVKIVGCIDNGVMIGYCIYSPRNFCAVLGKISLVVEYWYIKPQFRGQWLFIKDFAKYLAKECLRNGWDKIEWWVNDSNEKLVKFYKHYSARKRDTVGVDMVFDRQQIERLVDI
ncbi:MAG: GNAT family N-acetyltransferase [Rickettsiales bacterium]|jgi:hypothetical protein|nr:GNAT family N-acetyltransferase [Rickettsiales bacterium]